ncbi:hypothetical protein HMSSN036_21380 [Paenibacillus macerans]|uniref:Uncharacterized protein n=1 Tax=Paenibacillus macerans TaxID=44252 RepID=A0A091A094_PAEMA|nr:hypothetical protein [Paenibacillus macerans]KFN09751.1 hypothetical protein DJ90_3506 [Paenibacillus macerans]MBS5913205.1 hypothetical protein [Paenibacillus macerans]MCY7559744.1 hypothetical protein [Paenibacillus macerans]MDU7476414.1 hypothetical protein [Paenibacillus macerans]MEC0140029.1 hypothetical protein [Paenibacillus macerans]
MHELKIAVTLGHQVVVKLESGQIMTGLPKWGSAPDRVQLRTIEGAVWVKLNEISHVTRIIPFER